MKKKIPYSIAEVVDLNLYNREAKGVKKCNLLGLKMDRSIMEDLIS